MDPSLEGGFTQIFQRELQLTVRNSETAFEDAVMVRIFRNANCCKLQMTSQTNVSFFYVCRLGEQEGGLKATSDWLRHLFAEEYSFILELQSVTGAVLLVEKQEKYKKYEIGQVDLQIGSSQELRQSLMYRYERMKARQAMLDQYWQTISGIVRTKNPSLLMQLETKQRKNAFK